MMYLQHVSANIQGWDQADTVPENGCVSCMHVKPDTSTANSPITNCVECHIGHLFMAYLMMLSVNESGYCRVI